MKFQYTALCLCLALGTGFSLVSAKHAATAIDNESAKAPLLALPTEAPLMMSTAKPTLAPKKAPSPTKAIVLNTPPKMPHKLHEQMEENLEHKKNEPTLQKPAAAAIKSGSFDANLKAVVAKPVQVSGFITKNGNIFEIEGKDGIGLIEGRQSPSEEQENTTICNYGSVVIYSDVPCDEVTNVHVSDVKETQIKEGIGSDIDQQADGEQMPAAAQAAQANGLPHDSTTLHDLEDAEIEEELIELEKEQRRRRKQNQKRRRKVNPNRNQNRNRGGNRRHGNNNQRRGGQQLTRRQLQNRRRQQQNRQQQQQQQHRNRQQQRRRQQNYNNNNNRNRNRNRNSQQDEEVDDREQEYHRGRGV